MDSIYYDHGSSVLEGFHEGGSKEKSLELPKAWHKRKDQS